QVEPDANPDNASDQVAMAGKLEEGKSNDTGQSKDAGKKPVRDSGAKTNPGIDLPAPDEPDEEAVPVGKKQTALAGNRKQREPDAADDDTPRPTPKPPDDSDSRTPAAAAALPSKYVSTEGVTLHYVPREERWFRLPPPP